jgi:outer membrane protein assembly factor BamA
LRVYVLQSVCVKPVKRCSLLLVAGAIWLVGTPAIGVAQDDSSADSASGGNSLIPIPVFFTTPETGVAFGAGATYLIRSDSGGLSVRPSSLRAFAVYTAKKQLILSVGGELYLDRERHQARFDVSYLRFPTTFWGIGNDAPDAAEEDYTPRTFGVLLGWQRQVVPGWYAGLTAEFAHRRLLETEDGGLLATAAVPGVADGRVVGGGLAASRDTRDNTVYPRSGSFHQLTWSVFDEAIGSDYSYASTVLDLRHYVSVTAGHVMALRVVGIAKTATPPFDRLSELGGDVLLRGYFQGRFRDRQLLAVQGEYRLPVWWRVGVVGFAGAGQVARDLDGFDVDGVKLSAGLGLRVALSPSDGLNLRADWGYGFDVGTSGLYLGLGEAF